MINGPYRELQRRLKGSIPKERLLHDPLTLLAYSTDASFYKLVPKLVIKVENEREMSAVIREASNFETPITFRAAGTSLSGQAVSDSIVVVATHGWKNHKLINRGSSIALQPGIRGGDANKILAPLGLKIGPDPASIESAMIGGIAANNASGMCCGTHDNSYKTVEEVKVILSDGTLIDSSSNESIEAFKKSHSKLYNSLAQLGEEVKSNSKLASRIAKKYKIKNTNGYSLNALIDFSDPIDILKHLMIGSEGTLGFISEITYRTVVDEPNKGLALIIYPSIEAASLAVQLLKDESVTAVELMDRASLKSVEEAEGIPDYIKELPDGATALLVESSSETAEQLQQQLSKVIKSIEEIETLYPIEFTTDKKRAAALWKVRKEIFATVAGMRISGTTPIIEDICFPVKRLAEGTNQLLRLFKKHNYPEAVIFGHALEGNLHFVFNQDFQSESELAKYGAFMADLVEMVLEEFDGSLKAEHGTGRNMAPYVEREWGREAYLLMKRIKELFDPKNILNRGVILNDDKEIHLKNIKPMPTIRESGDSCMECGFCESSCVSEGLTLSPRQRIASYRQIEHLIKSGEEPHKVAQLNKLYRYSGDATCATDGLCKLACPLNIDTGKVIKELREERHSPLSNRVALTIEKRMGAVTALGRGSLNLLNGIRTLAGKKIFGAAASGLRTLSFNTLPLWNSEMPKGAKAIRSERRSESNRGRNNIKMGEKKVIYFPSCINRTMGLAHSSSATEEVTIITRKLLERANFEVIYPEQLNSLCCGMAFSSKGYMEAAERASKRLEEALYRASNGGEIPILCDMSPCLYTMKSNFGERLKLYEPAQFAVQFLLEQLTIKKLERTISLFTVCSAKELGVEPYLLEIAQLCASDVKVVESNCCGFAGDRGFIVPELNRHGLRELKGQRDGATIGYSTSRTCEIGLSNHGDIEYLSLFHLLEEASR